MLAACVCALLCVAALAIPLPTAYQRFDGSEVIRMNPQNEAQLHAVMLLRRNMTISLGLDWWTEPGRVGLAADLRVPLAAKATVQRVLAEAGVASTVRIPDVQALIDMEMAQIRGRAEGAFDFSQYHSLEEINEYVQSLPQQFPSLVSVITVARSYEGRNILAAKVTGRASNTTKPGFWMDAGIHAREWISPATVLYMLNELVTQYGRDPTITQLVDSLEVFVVPVFNVDGYAYTWTNNRMWRKTRSPNAGTSCIGTDANRNFGFHWGEIGASGDPCDETYYGAGPFSEVEAKMISEYIHNTRSISTYFNIHSYSQLWMSPWGYTPTRPKDFETQMDVAKLSAAALTAVHGTQYVVGQAYQTVYPTSGGTRDWTYGAESILYSFGIELRDTGQYGFLLPADQIIPSGEETLAGILVSMRYSLDHPAPPRP